MRLTFLGTGTSTGVPQLQCDCPVCLSSDPRDSRLRCSALLEVAGRHLLIDCGPDFRQQMLLYHRHGDIDALLVTHHHYDHVGGTDDLRPYCMGKEAFPIFCNADVAADLHRRMPYCFDEHPYPGVPRLHITTVAPFTSFDVCGVQVLPVQVNHYLLEILGFRIGTLAYITDAKIIPDATISALEGVDTLVINALRQEEHMSHMTLDEALAVVRRVKPRVAYLTHLSHHMGLTADIQPTLPEGVFIATDGATITIPD